MLSHKALRFTGQIACQPLPTVFPTPSSLCEKAAPGDRWQQWTPQSVDAAVPAPSAQQLAYVSATQTQEGL